MHRIAKLLTIATSFAVLFTVSVSAQAQDAAATYKSKCAMCHGADGKKAAGHDLSSADVQKKSDADLAAVIANGKWIHINMVPQRVIQTGTAWFAYGVQQPQFFTSKLTISPVVRNGQKTLVGFHALPDGTAEIFILQAWATVVK